MATYRMERLEIQSPLPNSAAPEYVISARLRNVAGTDALDFLWHTLDDELPTANAICLAIKNTIDPNLYDDDTCEV